MASEIQVKNEMTLTLTRMMAVTIFDLLKRAGPVQEDQEVLKTPAHKMKSVLTVSSPLVQPQSTEMMVTASTMMDETKTERLKQAGSAQEETPPTQTTVKMTVGMGLSWIQTQDTVTTETSITVMAVVQPVQLKPTGAALLEVHFQQVFALKHEEMELFSILKSDTVTTTTSSMEMDEVALVRLKRITTAPLEILPPQVFAQKLVEMEKFQIQLLDSEMTATPMMVTGVAQLVQLNQTGSVPQEVHQLQVFVKRLEEMV